MTTLHGNTKRKYKVKGIKAEGGAAGTMFNNEAEGREMSVAEYFEKQYQVRYGGSGIWEQRQGW